MGNPGECLFCKIAAKKIPCDKVYETQDVLGFKDINPQAPVHLLFIPKKHIGGVDEISSAQDPVLGQLVVAANHMASQLNIHNTGYRLVINCKDDGGQTVEHLHLHFLGGRRMTWPPG